MKLAIFWLSYLWFPFLIIGIYAIWRLKDWRRYLILAFVLLSLPLAWARFVEPRILIVHEETIELPGFKSEQVDGVRVGLIADLHIGIFSHAVSAQRIIHELNDADVDLILIAGDFTYDLHPAAVTAAFAALAQAEAPIYAVLGNHDVGFPGEVYGESLYGPLRDMGVTFVENRSVEWTNGAQSLIVSGTSDLWQRAYDFEFASNFPDDVPVLMLTHNPDMALIVPAGVEYDLMLAGHTHGGQIRLPIPGLTRSVIPTQYPFDHGLHRLRHAGSSKDALVYVTPGTGMIGLPMRFRRPPRIDILTLSTEQSG